jgi:hypothetical protein
MNYNFTSTHLNDLSKLKTGDLILCVDRKSTGIFGAFTSLIQWGTHSNYTHTAVVLKDPTFIHPHLKGLYVWESSKEEKPDPQDNKFKIGVQITPLSELIESYKNTGHIFYRSVQCPKNYFSDENLKQVHDVVYNKPYDIVIKDWIEAFFQKDTHPQKTDRFWCAALVGFIYTKCGLLNKNTDWSIMTPNDLSLSGENLNWNEYCSFTNEVIQLC